MRIRKTFSALCSLALKQPLRLSVRPRKSAFLLAGLLVFVPTSLASLAAIQPVYPAECAFLGNAGPVYIGVLDQPGRAPIRLRVPEDYLANLAFRSKGDLGVDRAFLLMADRGTLAPAGKSFRQSQARREERINILLSRFSPLDDWKARHEARIKRLHKSARFHVVKSQYGLHAYKRENQQDNDDTFFHYINGSISDSIQCNRKGYLGIKIPSCIQRTTIHNIDVEFTYPREWLQSWKQVRDDVSKFIKCIIHEAA